MYTWFYCQRQQLAAAIELLTHRHRKPRGYFGATIYTKNLIGQLKLIDLRVLLDPLFALP